VPDWRITCFFVGGTHRHRGVAGAALAGALDEIERLGGGLVESYPENTVGRKVSGWFPQRCHRDAPPPAEVYAHCSSVPRGAPLLFTERLP
jgi:hypothetical protein